MSRIANVIIGFALGAICAASVMSSGPLTEANAADPQQETRLKFELLDSGRVIFDPSTGAVWIWDEESYLFERRYRRDDVPRIGGRIDADIDVILPAGSQ